MLFTQYFIALNTKSKVSAMPWWHCAALLSLSFTHVVRRLVISSSWENISMCCPVLILPFIWGVISCNKKFFVYMHLTLFTKIHAHSIVIHAHKSHLILERHLRYLLPSRGIESTPIFTMVCCMSFIFVLSPLF